MAEADPTRNTHRSPIREPSRPPGLSNPSFSSLSEGPLLKLTHADTILEHVIAIQGSQGVCPLTTMRSSCGPSPSFPSDGRVTLPSALGAR